MKVSAFTTKVVEPKCDVFHADDGLWIDELFPNLFILISGDRVFYSNEECLVYCSKSAYHSNKTLVRAPKGATFTIIQES